MLGRGVRVVWTQRSAVVCSHFPLISTQSRGVKRWDADPTQLFVNNYVHAKPAEYQYYQDRRLRYARKQQRAPLANDYDTDFDEESMDSSDINALNDKMLESYKEYFQQIFMEIRREQILAKDDPQSPFFFSDEATAIAQAQKQAEEGATERVIARYVHSADGEPIFNTKRKIVGPKLLQEDFHNNRHVTTLIPDADIPDHPNWSHYPIDTAYEPMQEAESKKTTLPLVPPEFRFSKIKNGKARAIGKRKTAVAQVYISAGTGEFVCNGRRLIEYFPTLRAREAVIMPLMITETMFDYDVVVSVRGGGIQGQAEAIRHGISRALENYDPNHRLVLKEAGLLKRDPRSVERKKPGKPKARKSFTWVKR